jgi:transcription elongation GreA/GreB family factor
MGIEPMTEQDAGQTQNRFTEYRTISPPDEVSVSATQTVDIDQPSSTRSEPLAAVGLGDKVVLFFSDTNKRLSARLFEDGEDLEKGRLSIHSVLGRVVSRSEEGDEIEYSEGGRARKVLIESVEKSLILEINSEIDPQDRSEESRPAAAVG